MVDKQDLYLKIKVNYEGQSMEINSKDLPNLDHLKNIIMDKFGIPNIKDYLDLSCKNNDNNNSLNNFIKKDEDLFKYSNEITNSNIYYLELDLKFNFSYFKSKAIINLNHLYQKQKENKCIGNMEFGKKVSELTKKAIEEKKMKIKELYSQINEIKKRNEEKKKLIKEKKIIEVNNKHTIKIKELKRELEFLKFNNFNNNFKDTISNDLILLIQQKISENLENKNKYFCDIINKLKESALQNIKKTIDDKMFKSNEIYKKEISNIISIINNNLKEISNDLLIIQNEINKIKEKKPSHIRVKIYKHLINLNNTYNSGDHSETNDYHITKNIENVFFGKPEISKEDESIIIEYYYYLINQKLNPTTVIKNYFHNMIEPKMKKKFDFVINLFSLIESKTKEKIK